MREKGREPPQPVAGAPGGPLLRRIEPTFGMEPEEYPIDGVLDLHVFDPSEVGDLVPEYLRACREKGILRVRIIHGKGTGQLRRSVHAILDRLDTVTSYETAKDASSWGATIAYLEDGA